MPFGAGLDNIRDVVVGVGTAGPLRASWLAALAGHMTGEDDLDQPRPMTLEMVWRA